MQRTTSSADAALAEGAVEGPVGIEAGNDNVIAGRATTFVVCANGENFSIRQDDRLRGVKTDVGDTAAAKARVELAGAEQAAVFQALEDARDGFGECATRRL